MFLNKSTISPVPLYSWPCSDKIYLASLLGTFPAEEEGEIKMIPHDFFETFV
jgi:hypothetical protein